MKYHKTNLRVRYAETDQMGVVHHGNYAEYLELARIEWMEQFGISYKNMEKNGIMLPVYEMNFKFKKPAHFDDILSIETSLREAPSIRIIFDYKIRNQEGKLLTTASTTLVFMNAKTKQPISCPENILKTIGF